MGEIHDLRCNKCGYGIKAWLGIGMMYSPEQVFYGKAPSLKELVADESISNEALSLIKSGQKASDDYGHALYACPDDNYLFERFSFKVGEFEPNYPCPYCDKSLQQVTFAKGNLGTTRLKFVDTNIIWHCPKCKNELLKEISFANWD